MEFTFLDCKQHAGAGLNTLMSISDGLGPSFFCRKMEKARPMREKWMERFIISRQSRHFNFDVIIFKVLFPICTWLGV